MGLGEFALQEFKGRQNLNSAAYFLMQGSDTMDYWFTRVEDRSEQIKKHIKEAAQSIIDHADDIVDQYDLLTDLKIEMNLNPDNNWLPKVQVTSSFLSERTIMLKKDK